MKPYIELKVKEQEEEALKERAKAEQESKENLELSLERCQNLIKYFEEVEGALIAHGAKTWAELDPVAAAAQEAPKQNVPPFHTYGMLPSLEIHNVVDSEGFFVKHFKTPSVPLSFYIFRTQWSSELAPVHTVSLYEELFEAIWRGNNKRVKELCLPSKTNKRKRNNGTYLQITCEVRFSPSIPFPPCTDDDMRTEISSFKKYPREVGNIASGRSIQSRTRAGL